MWGCLASGAAQRRQRWLAASAEVNAEPLAGTDPVEALRLIAGRAVELAGALLAAFLR